jgi:glutamate racemase
MAIGVFDSGVGGLTVLRALDQALPRTDILYLADQANTPYGGREGEEIVALTRAGCERLFDLGCDLVFLACNTAAAVALRRLQQTWLPGERSRRGRPVNVLGLIVPTIEAATGIAWNDALQHRSDKLEKLDILGVFSTPATAKSRVYEIEIAKRSDAVAVFSEPCATLARQIESGEPDDVLMPVVEAHIEALSRRIGRPPDRAILGCTHYEIIAELFKAALPPGTPLIHQPAATAESAVRYIGRHPEFDPGAGGVRRFLTTGPACLQNGLVERFWGRPLGFQRADVFVGAKLSL